jgi:hypothetical protein
MSTPDFYSRARPEREVAEQPTDFYSLARPSKYKPLSDVPYEKTFDPGWKDYGYGPRETGEPKGRGFFGMMPMKDNKHSGFGELSFDLEEDGKTYLVPAVVPGLNREQLDYLATGARSWDRPDITKIAIEHAHKRLKEGKSPFAHPDEEGKTPIPEYEGPKEQTFTDRVKNYFTSDKFGEALVMQQKAGGHAGAPVLHPKEAKEIAAQVGTVGAVEAAFTPLLGAAAASTVAPRVLTALTRLTQAGTTGVAVATTNKLLESGELPSKEELVKDGLTWVAIDAIMQGLPIVYDFGKAVNNIAKEQNVPATKVLGQLWESAKNWIKVKTGRIVTLPTDIKPEDVQTLVDVAKVAEEQAPKAPVAVKPPEKPPEAIKPIEVTPTTSKPTIIKPEKPKEVEKPKVERPKYFSLMSDEGKAKYDDALVRLGKIRQGTEERKLTKTQKREMAKIYREMSSWDFIPQDRVDSHLKRANELEREGAIKKSEPKSTTPTLPPKVEVKPTKPVESEKPQLPETRGKGQFYHGSPSPVEKPTSEHYSTQNYYGQGFYTTDALDIAHGYASRKGKAKEPTIYEVREKHPVKLFDMETPIPVDIKKQLEDLNYHDAIADSLTSDPKQTLRELYDDMRNAGLSADSIQEEFDTIARKFEKKGYGGLQHIGGKLTGKKPHIVKIYFNPETQIEINKYQPKVIEPSTPSSYIRKTTPTTVTDKIAHLTSKIKESEKYSKDLNDKIQKLKAERAAMGQRPAINQGRKLYDLKRSSIANFIQDAMQARNNERVYADQLKRDLKDLKAKKEKSNVQVPLGNLELRVKPEAKKYVPAPPETAHKKPIMGTEQAAKRSDIINLFRKAFHDPIRMGKFRSNRGAFKVKGLHFSWPKVTRLLEANDVESAAHEIGHNLHTTLYGGNAVNAAQQSQNVDKALRPYLKELKPISRYEPFGREGFAEFTRMYVTNPEGALKLAPQFYAKFEADLDAQYPEMKNALLEAREYYSKYLQGTPESRIDAQTSFGEDQSKLDNLTEWVKSGSNLDNLKTELLDDVFPAKRAVAEAFGIPTQEVENLKDPRNLYRSLRVLKGAIGKADVYVIHETFDPRTLKKTGNSLRSILRQLKGKKEYKEFNRYLIARRSIEKQLQNIKTGIQTSDAIQVEKDLRPKYGKLAGELDKYNDSLLKYARDSGLLSNEQYAEIKKSNVMYAPFQRVMEEEKGGTASAAGRLQAGKPIKKMKGSTRDIIAPIESVIKNTYAIIINAEKNMCGQVMAKLSEMKDMGKYIERVPTPTTIKATTPEGEKIFGATKYPARENIVTVYYDGKPRYYEVSPEIYEMWTKGTAPYTANLITKVLRIPARTLRAGAILNPKFMQKNFIRDTWGGFLFTKYGKNIKDPAGLFIDTLYTPLSMLAQAAKQGPLYIEWLKAGGGMSTMQSLDRASVVKKMKEIRDGYKPYQVMKWLRKVAEISEEANRLSEFSRALKVEGNTRLGMEIAAFASRDLSIDFAKIGLQTKMLNQIIPFYNATIQGGDKLVRSGMNKDDRTEFYIRGISFIAIPSLIFAWLNRHDDRTKEFQEQEKDFNFITFIGDTAIKIPVPFETGVILNGLTQRCFNYMMTKDPAAFEGFIGSIGSAMMPNFIPSFANPIIEAQANKNFFTSARIIPPGKEGLIAKYQYKNYTSSTARLLGRAMSYMLGQETRSKAASPAVIDHFINSWGGGLGRLMISISDVSLEAAGLGDKVAKPGQAITERFELDAFTARYPRANTASIEKFYDNYQDAVARQKSFKYAEKMDLESPEAIERGYKRLDRIYDMDTLQNAYKAMQSCQKEINNIWNDPSIEKDLKKKMIDDLYLQQIEFAKAANADIRQYQLSQKK